ncbi:MAG TPA: protein kinase [Polyangia bacterium]|nr:protein kinase [Polyangia bacterium]
MAPDAACGAAIPRPVLSWTSVAMGDLVGTTLGNYRLSERIGQGGMGEVYVAEHRRISRRVAVKVLLPELSANQTIVERFLSEARTASLIRHPGIVEIFDCDEDAGRAFIVMELLEGETLAARLQRDCPLSADGQLAALIGGQIAQAVAAAHASGVVHRDLKPDNVFLIARAAPTGDFSGGFGIGVKVVDFGIAKLASPEATSRTQTGALLGTPIYMSPEQCRGAGRVDHRADIYSLGCILFEMVCGHPPFVRVGAGDLLIAHMTEPPPPVQALNPGVPAALQALIADMLAKDPEARPPSMTVVATHLGALGMVPPGARTALLPAAVETPAPPKPIRPSRSGSGARARSERGLRPARPRPTPDPRARTTLSASAREQEKTVTGARRSVWLLGGGVALAVAAAVAVLVTVRPGAQPIAAVAPPVKAPPREIAVHVANLPAGGSLLLDGQPTANPIHLARQPGEKHIIKARAPGYIDHDVDFTADNDMTIAIGLQPVATPPAPAPPAAAPARKPKPRARPPSQFRALPDEPAPQRSR